MHGDSTTTERAVMTSEHIPTAKKATGQPGRRVALTGPIRQRAAQAVIAASKKTGDPVPAHIYKIAEGK